MDIEERLLTNVLATLGLQTRRKLAPPLLSFIFSAVE